MQTSRTQYAVKNIQITVFLYLLTYLTVFLSRTFFIKILGNDFLSISGLFTNVITVLSFTELGIGSASIYCLYKPIANNDYLKINAFLGFFKKLYNYVFLATLGIGLLFIPILPYIITIDSLLISYPEIVLFYSLYVINTSCSYLLLQNKLFLTANQQSYKANIIQHFAHIIQLILQTMYLFFTHDFIGYLIIQIICTIATNYITSYYVKTEYPKIFESKGNVILYNEKKELKTNILSIFYYKIGAVILNGTDIIIISSFLQTTLVGVCSNYTLLIGAANSFLMQCFNSIAASIGNHTVKESKQQQEIIFRQLDTLCVYVFSVVSVCLLININPLINMWIGEQYLLDNSSKVAMIGVFYFTGVNQIPSLYRTSLGLFKAAKFLPLFASFLNIVLSIFLANNLGLCGVFIATIIVRILFFTLVDSYLVYKRGFFLSPRNYYIKFLMGILFCLVTYYVIILMINQLSVTALNGLILNIVISFFLSLMILFLLYIFTSDFRKLIIHLKSFIMR